MVPGSSARGAEQEEAWAANMEQVPDSGLYENPI